MSTYLTINLIIIAVPLFLTWLPRYSYYRLFKPLLKAIAMVGLIYIPWDMWATATGQWAFNPVHISSLFIGPIPLDEFLFFVTVPYSCLFLLYAFFLKCGPDQFKFDPRPMLFGASGSFFILSLLNTHRIYTFTVCLVAALYLLITTLRNAPFYQLRVYWYYLLVGFGLFLIFNSILTSLPIVTYDPQAITGLRVGTIPLEDFVYNFVLLSAYAWFFTQNKFPRSPTRL